MDDDDDRNVDPCFFFYDFNSLPCLIFMVCLRDTFIPEGRKLRDPRRLYAPGRMYHIVERKFCRFNTFLFHYFYDLLSLNCCSKSVNSFIPFKFMASLHVLDL